MESFPKLDYNLYHIKDKARKDYLLINIELPKLEIEKAFVPSGTELGVEVLTVNKLLRNDGKIVVFESIENNGTITNNGVIELVGIDPPDPPTTTTSTTTTSTVTTSTAPATLPPPPPFPIPLP